MNTVDPSLSRYRSLRQRFDRLPADNDGTRFSTQAMDVPEKNGFIGSGSRTDADPDTHDILHFSSDQDKTGFQSESFVEMPAPRGFFGGKKGPETLVHLSRRVSFADGTYSLSNVALRTIDLVTGEVISESKGDAAVRGAQKLDDQIPFRLHYVDPQNADRNGSGWLVS